jgi:ribosomal protein L29
MKKNEMKSKTALELHAVLHDSLIKKFYLRMQQVISPKKVKSSEFKNIQKIIARAKTIIHEKANDL